MKRSTKITSIIIIFFLIIATVIIGRTMIGNHFKKKFSKRPPPGIIITVVEEKIFENIISTYEKQYSFFAEWCPCEPNIDEHNPLLCNIESNIKKNVENIENIEDVKNIENVKNIEINQNKSFNSGNFPFGPENW